MRSIVRARTLEQSFSISTALLVLCVIGASMLVIQNRVRANMRRGLEARGAAIAKSIGAVATPSLLAYNYAALQMAAEGAAGNDGVVFVAIHDKEGALAGVSGRAPAETTVRDPMDSVAITSRDVEVDREDGTGSRELAVEVSVPVRVEGVNLPWGRVRVGLTYDIVASELRELGIQLFVLGTLLAAIAVLCGRWLARRIAAPIEKLAEGTEALAGGDLDHRIPVSGAKELCELARAFNTMSDRLQAKACESQVFQDALERLNSTLEHQVIERTRALEESTVQYKSLVESSPDSILIVQQGAVRFVNRSFTETFRITEYDALHPDFHLSQIFDPTSTALAEGRIAAWERGESPSPIEVLGKDAMGRTRHLELRGSRIDYQGSPAAECLLVDMTEAKRLRERLAETEKLRALGELASGVAHDFNNLLGAILGRSQLLRRRELPAEVDRDLEIIEKAAQDGRETVRRIQEFSRTRRDKKFEAVDLSEILRDALEITKTRWKDDTLVRPAPISVVFREAAGTTILGSASELREVFTNLILNAIDAMPEGGRLEVSCREEGEQVIAQVADTGVGMSESVRQNIFDPFFTTKGSSGMGLGMSVVYGIVTRHGGTIDVETALAKGTTFTLTFKATRAQEIRSVGSDGAALPDRVRPGRILVVDDEPEVAAVVKDVLMLAGHSVDTAGSGSVALEMVRLTAYDLVFTDLGMPDMSGWEVAEKISAARPGLTVALVTGWGTSIDEADSAKRGISAVVHKPFEIDELLATAQRLLSNSVASGGN